ncbi:hypothetical protein CSUI_010328 [Cystoisospora suis]|uniref:Uncharacterized protein n=1 Tax=Cystoisospora suis TaxID=483139 RepID=A0A2C6KGS5_9APIC|nr:hypothetical protein CSUI_010328 [Cystoisospora suis]
MVVQSESSSVRKMAFRFSECPPHPLSPGDRSPPPRVPSQHGYRQALPREEQLLSPATESRMRKTRRRGSMRRCT